MRCVCGIVSLVMIINAQALVVPSALRLSAVAPSARLSRQPGGRAVTMISEGLPPGDPNNSMDDPNGTPSTIPDRVGSAAIKRRIDSMKRSGGADKKAVEGKRVRWVTTTDSGHRAMPSYASQETRSALPRAVWVLLFSQGSPSFSSGLPQRGLYCLWSKGVNSVVAFEERDGALRYAFKLKAKGLGIPEPTRVATMDLQRFCLEHTFGIWMIPADVAPEAPRKTKKDSGFNPFNVAAPSSSRGRGAGGRGWRGEAERHFSPHASTSNGRGGEESVPTPEDIRKWRAEFERLYAQE